MCSRLFTPFHWSNIGQWYLSASGAKSEPSSIQDQAFFGVAQRSQNQTIFRYYQGPFPKTRENSTSSNSIDYLAFWNDNKAPSRKLSFRRSRYHASRYTGHFPDGLSKSGRRTCTRVHFSTITPHQERARNHSAFTNNLREADFALEGAERAIKYPWVSEFGLVVALFKEPDASKRLRVPIQSHSIECSVAR
jgi:hypothetical protein